MRLPRHAPFVAVAVLLAGCHGGGSSDSNNTPPPDTTPPSMPGALTANAASSSQIDLNWGAAADDVGVVGYQLERCQGAGCTTFTQVATPSGTSYSDAGMSPATSYSYRVRAADAAGNVGPFSNTGSATTPAGADTQSPVVPSGLTATAASTDQINLTWTATTDNVGVTGYRLERCQGAGCTTFAQIAAPSGTSFSDTGLSLSTFYSYRIRAVDAAGNLSPFSSTSSATTLAVPDSQAPTAPSGLSATAVSNIRINLSWMAATDNVVVASYRLERCQGSGCTTFAQIATPSGTSYSDTSLSASTSYSYRVRAVDGAGNVGPFSNTGSATTQAAAPIVGLDVRPSNTTCVAPAKASSTAGSTISLQRVFGGISFDQPLAMMQAPGDNSRWFVLEKTGAVRVFANTPNVSTASTFLSLAVNDTEEGGLLGMAFSPNWATNHQVFVSFTEGSPMVSVIARFTSTDNGLTLDSSTRQNVFRVNQPYTNHNGGNIAFGPDGSLYIGFGDGGNSGDPQGHGQNTTDVLGDFLRLNVTTLPYTIPADNPFAATGAMCGPDPHASSGNCKEIYAWGVRNPWRWSFDLSTGDLWAGDVGQDTYEEIDKIARGGNYGWNCREGTHAFNNCSTNPAGFVEPLIDYSHSEGNSITGGYVYRGSALPALAGVYLFADFGSGRIWRLVQNGSTYTKQQLLDTTMGISSFGQGNDGELYVVDIYGGALYKIIDGSGGGSSGSPVPTLLSDTGCVDSQNPSQLAAGVIPYAPAAAFWSDGATKERGLAIPNGTSIAVGSDGDFTFPSGSVLVKNFRLNGSLIETRLFMRHPDGDWAGYTYEWNAQQTNATLVTGGKTTTIGGQTWRFPSGAECDRCHTGAAGYVLGAEAAQLNHDFVYTSTGRTANELRTLDSITMFTAPLGDPANQPAMPDPANTAAPLDQRARAYLHTNCSQCHRPSGGTPSSMDLRYATALASTAACNAMPQSGDLGIGAAARIIAPGSPSNSVLVARANRRDTNGMPPLASSIVDSAGVTLLQQWITSLTTCQ